MKKKTIIIIVSILVVFFVILSIFAIQNIKTQRNNAPEELPKSEQNINNNMPKKYISLDNEWIKNNKEHITSISFEDQNEISFPKSSGTIDEYKSSFEDGKLTISVPRGVILKNNLKNMFKDWENLKEINGLEMLDFSEITSLEGTFQNSGIEKINLNNADLSNLTTAKSAFENCSSLKTIDMPGGMESLKNTERMFKNCVAAETISLKDNHLKLNNASYMFAGVGGNYNCNLLPTFYIDEVSDVSHMFEDSRLKDYYKLAKNINTGNVRDMTSMFENATVKKLDLSSWETQKLEKTDRMFYNDSSAQSINISNWDAKNIKSCSEMFFYCTSLIELKIDWKNINKIINADSMFAYCTKIEELDLSCFNGINIINADKMFAYCSSLKDIFCEGFITFSGEKMFDACTGLNEDLRSWVFDNEGIKKDGSMAQSVDGYFKERKGE